MYVLSGIRALAGALAFSLLPSTAPAGPEISARITREYDLKAAFLFNFAQFVDWPSQAFPDSVTPITIGILGDDPFGKSLDEIVANEVVHGRKLVVRRYRSADQIGACHILFISPAAGGRQDEALAGLERRGVLTVGETPDFATRSGIVGFVISQNRMRLRINVAAASAAGLTISSKLLRQALIVGANPASEP